MSEKKYLTTMYINLVLKVKSLFFFYEKCVKTRNIPGISNKLSADLQQGPRLTQGRRTSIKKILNCKQ